MIQSFIHRSQNTIINREKLTRHGVLAKIPQFSNRHIRCTSIYGVNVKIKETVDLLSFVEHLIFVESYIIACKLTERK